MKFLIILALAVAASAFPEPRLHQRSREMPVVGSIEGRITGGSAASVGQFPYQVGLRLNLNSWCGGSLIGNEWVLTAAHCTQGVLFAFVYLGATVRTSPEVIRLATRSNIVIHSGFNADNLSNDISLIKIAAVTFSSRIQVIELPSIAISYPTYAGDIAIASGWGRTTDSTSISTRLNYAKLPVITNSVCASAYGTTVVTGNTICVSTPGGRSTCAGDSGGPLALESPKTLIGISSFVSSAGCQSGAPAGFIRVTSYLEWIKSRTGISS